MWITNSVNSAISPTVVNSNMSIHCPETARVLMKEFCFSKTIKNALLPRLFSITFITH